MNPNSEAIKPVTEAPAKPARFTVQVEYDGFPVEVEIEGKADALKQMIDRLKSVGATPPAQKSSAVKPSVPTCPVHHTPMKASRKPGSFFCPRKTDDGDYCPEKA